MSDLVPIDPEPPAPVPLDTAPPDLPPVAPPRVSPLDALHRRLGARLVEFAGWVLPVSYPAGLLAEHAACRTGAALFDVSHMGQLSLAGEAADTALEGLVPADLLGLKPGRQRYTQFLNETGGMLDDLMVSRLPGRLFVVVNASRQADDLLHLRKHLPDGVRITEHPDRALLALQGPRASAILGGLAPAAAAMAFLSVAELDLAGIACWVSRSGYTGEDGYEISVPAEQAERLAGLLLDAGAAPAGLGARDSLRLEAGLCLYGSDIDELTTPVEAGLGWSIQRRRREQGGYPGAVVLADQFANGTTRQRVGLRLEGRAPARAMADIVAEDGTLAGAVTSGTVSPTLNAPIAMGYVRSALAAEGTRLHLRVRGRDLPASVVPTPFVPHRYAR